MVIPKPVPSAKGSSIGAKVKRKGEAERQQTQRKISKLEQTVKKLNVTRTQKWRLKVKLISSEPPTTGQSQPSTTAILPSSLISDSPDHCASPSRTAYQSRTTEWRAVQKAKTNLPQTPLKKARIITKLAMSPSCVKILTKSNVLMTLAAQGKLVMGDMVMNCLATSIQQAKPRGGITAKQKLKYAAL